MAFCFLEANTLSTASTCSQSTEVIGTTLGEGSAWRRLAVTGQDLLDDRLRLPDPTSCFA